MEGREIVWGVWALFAIGLLVASSGGMTTLIRGQTPPVWLWFVVPALAELWTLVLTPIALPLDRNDLRDFWVVWLVLAFALGANALLLVAASLHGLPLLLAAASRRGSGVRWAVSKAAGAPLALLLAGAVYIGFLVHRFARAELGILPAGITLGAVVPWLLTAVAREDTDWLVARSRISALYGSAALFGVTWLANQSRYEIACGLPMRLPINEIAIAGARALLLPCGLLAGGVTALTIGPSWRRAAPVAVASLLLLAPWICYDAVLQRSFAGVFSGGLSDIAIDLPDSVDLIGRYPERAYLPMNPCLARLQDARWVLVPPVQPEDCKQWLLAADRPMRMGDLLAALPRENSDGFSLLVRGSWGPFPAARLRELAISLDSWPEVGSAPDAIVIDGEPFLLGPSAHEALRAHRERRATDRVWHAQTVRLDPDWTVQQFVHVCSSTHDDHLHCSIALPD